MAIFVLGFSSVAISSSDARFTRVAPGGNGSTWDTFSPQTVKINAGDSLTWHNPSPVAEPHTVTFLTNQSHFPPLAAPFSIPSNIEISSTLPNPNVEPIVLPPSPTDTNESKTIIMDNAMSV